MDSTDDNARDEPSHQASERARLLEVFCSIQDFLLNKKNAGELTNDEESEIAKAHNRAFDYAGLEHSDASFLSNAVFRQALSRQLAKIKELHPEWRTELDQLSVERGRGSD